MNISRKSSWTNSCLRFVLLALILFTVGLALLPAVRASKIRKTKAMNPEINSAAKFRFEVSFPEGALKQSAAIIKQASSATKEMNTATVDGRLLLLISTNNEKNHVFRSTKT